MRTYADRAQFIVITHQKRTMEAADVLYGVTMGTDGISQIVSRRAAARGRGRGDRVNDLDVRRCARPTCCWSHQGVETWVFGGWGEELRGLKPPAQHADLDLLYPGARDPSSRRPGSRSSTVALGGIGPGVPVRETVSDFGARSAPKVLEANETQEQSLDLVFHYADQKGLPLLDLSDLRALLTFLSSDEGKAELHGIGGLSSRPSECSCAPWSGWRTAAATSSSARSSTSTTSCALQPTAGA